MPFLTVKNPLIASGGPGCKRPSPLPRCQSRHLRQRHFGLGQPEAHVHVTVQHHGGGRRSVGLLPLADPGMQDSEAQVAVGHERAHAQRLGQGEGLPVMRGGGHDLGRVVLRGNLAE